jgi:hypothetical protein
MSHDNLQYCTVQFKCKNNYLLNSISFSYFKLYFVVKLDIQVQNFFPQMQYWAEVFCGEALT